MPYMQKEIKSGKYLEVEAYPVNVNGARIPERDKKKKESSEAQKKLNKENAKKLLTRYLNANFTEQDIFITLTHKNKDIITLEEMEREAINFFRRLENKRRALALPELKYIYVFGKDKRNGIHIHAVVSGDGMTREEIEAVWSINKYNPEKGRKNFSRGITKTSFLEEDENGFERLAVYLLKNSAQIEAAPNKRKWRQSKNLSKPVISKPKPIKRMNARQAPKPRKGYTVVCSNQTVNDYTGAIYRRTLYRKM